MVQLLGPSGQTTLRARAGAHARGDPMRPGGGWNSAAVRGPKAWTLAVAIAAVAATSADGALARSFAPPHREGVVVHERTPATQVLLREMLTSQGPDSPVGAYLPSVRQQLVAFYERRGFRPAWVGGLLELQRARAILRRAWTRRGTWPPESGLCRAEGSSGQKSKTWTRNGGIRSRLDGSGSSLFA